MAFEAPERPESIWRIFRHISDDEWNEVGELTGDKSYYEPDADEIGQEFGEGQYLLIERDGGYSTRVREKLIVARRYYEEQPAAASAEAVA